MAEDSNFNKLVKKLQTRHNLPEENAKRLAAWIGRRKYGKAGMARKAAEGRKQSEG